MTITVKSITSSCSPPIYDELFPRKYPYSSRKYN